MTKEKNVKSGELKEFSITVENMKVGDKTKLCLILRLYNPIKMKYDLFESEVPKSSFLGKEVAGILKDAKKVLKDSLKKK
jgi:hypothetical protein